MGVLIPRLHGSISAIAAVAAASAWIELPDKSALKSIFDNTGQTLLLSSVYAPIASSSFEAEFGFAASVNPATAPMVLSHPPNTHPMVRGLPSFYAIVNGTPLTSFASQSASIRFYKAEPVLTQRKAGRPHLQPASLGMFYASRLLRSKTRSSQTFSASAWFMICGSMSVPPHSHVRISQPTSWKHPGTAQVWHAYIDKQHQCAIQVPIFRLPHGFQLEKVFSILYGGHASPPSASLLHMWHGPLITSPAPDDSDKDLVKQKPAIAVVLLGWLGSEHRHLKKYADWYTSRGIHAVTFVVPMKDLLTFKAGDKAERHVDVLTQNLVQWLKEGANKENEKIVLFHTFSNTGWLTYGAVLERLIGQGDDFLGRIKGCIIDSAPAARPDPQVWASGFSAALLKKGSVATQVLQSPGAESFTREMIALPKPSLKETALLMMLEKFFAMFLQIPYVSRRLNDVVSVLTNQQPSCPQLYIYSSADVVIPAKSIESFIEKQQKAGHMVRACNFECSPHVDHFRTCPDKYSAQLTSFLKMCVPQWNSP